MLETSRQQRQHTAGFPVEAAPEAHDLMPAGCGSRQAHRRLDRLGTARVQLRAIEIPGREARDQLDERGAMLRREAADVHALQLLRHLGDIAGMRIPQACHAHAGQEVDVAVAIQVPENRALASIHAQLAEEGDALRSGREVLGLGVEHTP